MNIIITFEYHILETKLNINCYDIFFLHSVLLSHCLPSLVRVSLLSPISSTAFDIIGQTCSIFTIFGQRWQTFVITGQSWSMFAIFVRAFPKNDKRLQSAHL